MDRQPPAHDLYLILERFRLRFAQHLAAFSELLASDTGLGVVCCYCSKTDIAMLAVAPPQNGLPAIIAAARRANAAQLDPARMSVSDRRSFYEQYLPRYDQRGERCASVSEALQEMAARLHISPTDAGSELGRLPLAGASDPRGQLAPLDASGPRFPRATGSETGPRRVRLAQRFPIRWPVTVIAGTTARMTLSARDISRSGMFIATVHTIRRQDIGFVISHDTGGRPIAGRARIVREVAEPAASDRGLERGVGIEIVQMRAEDEPRLEQFIERIERRSASRILIGAQAGRAEVIAHDLTAAGYLVVATTSPQQIEKAASESRPFDLVILDEGLTANGSERLRLRMMFAGKAPCLALPSTRPTPTRAAIDLLLRISTLR